MPPVTRVLWSAEVGAPPRGVALAREAGRVLAWDADGTLHLFDRGGGRQARRQLPAAVSAAAAADDGSAYAAAAGGRAYLLAPDLAPRWERPLAAGPAAVALDAFGGHLAAADAAGLHLFDRGGRRLWRAETPRPLAFLAFAAERPVLAGSADFGLAACFDRTGRCLWRDAPVAHTGALAVSGDAGLIALACFSDGLCCYSAREPQQRRLPDTAPCRLAAVSYDGATLLTAGLGEELHLRDAGGRERAALRLGAAPAALALSPLGDWAVAALAAGAVAAFETRV
jgi:hypothetical protein